MEFTKHTTVGLWFDLGKGKNSPYESVRSLLTAVRNRRGKFF